MEYDEEDNGAAGSIPEFGAIFMSNIVTKKECFKRKIFALPSSKAEFVKHVKAGMVLFLFEFKKRQLFGVYQASSDGAMDIVPHGFKYSGKHFPAQVCFTPIWYCDPLSEKEFRDAIRENYFSAKKFNFGLSEDQVRRLLSLFSSRKLKNKMPPHPLAEAVVGVAGKDRGLVGDDRFQLSEGEYIEYDEFNPAVFGDYHVNSLARAKEEEVLIDDRVNTEEKLYPLAESDFLAKRRRLDNDDRLITNDVTEMYSHGTLQTFRIDSSKHSLEEVRRLADARRLLTVERLHNENQGNKNLYPVLSSEYLMGPLDVRTADDDRFMQRNRLFDEYNMDNGSGQAFASERYGKPLDKSKHTIDDDRFLFDDCIQRQHNSRDTAKPMVYGDGNLNLGRQATEVIEDHPCSMNRKVENRYHLDCDGCPVSAFEHSASHLHKIRKTTAAGRFPINDRIESEPNYGTCSVEGFSSENFSHPLHCGHRIIPDRKYPIVEGRLTENMVDNIICSAASTRNAGCFARVDGRVAYDGRFRKSERVDNEDGVHTRISPVISMEYPSFSKRNQNLSSFSDKLLPEKGLPQLTVAHKFDSSRSTFDDATITRAVPYIPERPNFSHGCSASMATHQNCSLVRENHPHHGSLGKFYSLSKNRSSPYVLESKKSSRSLDIAPEFGNKGLPTTNTSGQPSSLLHEATSSFLNSNLSMHMDLNTSAHVNYRGSLYSKLSLTSPPGTSRENVEGEKGVVFTYPSKSSENHFAFDRNLPAASQHVSEHVPWQEMDMLAGKDFICSEAKDFSLGIYHPERDFASYENQYFGISSNMNLKENHEISEAPHFDSNVNRRSVFTRLTSRQEVQVGEERNGSDFNCHDCYMDATADEVMEMLQQGNNQSLRKLRKFRVVGQPKHGESAVDEKQIRSHIEINHSSMEKKKLNDAHLAIAESIEEVPKETRIMDFKRRSDTKKNLVGTSTGSAIGNKITGANEEVESSMKTTSKRKKLVRPVFRKMESATDAICSNQSLQLPGRILDKDDKRSCERAISICEAEIPSGNTRSSNVLASCTHQSMDCNIKEHSNPEEQKDLGAHVLPSTSHELKGHKTSNMGLQIGSSHVLLTETTQHKNFGIQTSVEGSLNLDESSSEGLKLGAGCGNNLIEEKILRMLKSKNKIIKTNKADVEPSQ
ncbi:hypothetical protein Pfo_012483 [Paulownia fortunei]|nr:hypothetical protein Pfo_012483 [Paulownia fortunei]